MNTDTLRKYKTNSHAKIKVLQQFYELTVMVISYRH